MAALVWVVHLAITHREDRLSHAALLDELIAAANEESDTPTPSIAAPDKASPEPAFPEVWTRMAGLNVWLGGKREERSEGATRIVVMLHGYGKPRETLLMLAEREATRFGTVFLFPEAPVALDWRRRAWWNPGRGYRENGHNYPPHEGLVTARRTVLALLDEVRRRLSVTPDEIVLAGFSQGATLALEVALNAPEPLGGLALLSAKPLEFSRVRERIARLQEVKVLIAHGRWDPVASFNAADRLRRALRRDGIQVTWVPYDGGHVISAMAQRQFSRFIAVAIDPDEPGATFARNRAGNARLESGTSSDAHIGVPTAPASLPLEGPPAPGMVRSPLGP